MYKGFEVRVMGTSVYTDTVRYELSHSTFGVIVVDAPEFNEENRLAIFDQQIDELIKRFEKKGRENQSLIDTANRIKKENEEYEKMLLPPLTKYQCAVISTYTGILIGKFEWTHEYIEKIMGRPVWTHELGDKAFYETIKSKARADFIKISDYAIGYNAPLGNQD